MVIIVIYKSEGRIQSEILLAASKNGHRLFRVNAGKIKTEDGRWIKLFPPGFPDTCGWHGVTGQFIAIEVKTPTGRLRPDQINFRDFAETQPIIYGVARSAQEAVDIIENGSKYLK